LEDFIDFNNIWPQFKTTQIELNTTTLVDPTDDPSKFYSIIAKNLKSALPNLEQLKLGGGYRFESNIETVDGVISKLRLMKDSFTNMIEKIKDRGVNVTFDKYVVDFVLPEKVMFFSISIETSITAC
jgi:hypothetical protein